MKAEDLESYIAAMGHEVELMSSPDDVEFTIVRGIEIPTGGLRGRICDVAIQRVQSEPYLVPAAIHTRPALVAMNTGEPLGTQGSPLGPEWQYWSRRFDRPPTPQAIWTHVLTVLGDDRWEPV
jgi:hypothetical protein